MRIDKSWIIRFLIMTAAVLFIGFALSFLIEVNWGLDPASFSNKSVSSLIGLSLGTWYVIEYAVMLVIVIIFNRKLIGVGTVVNTLCIGYTADFCCFVWEKIIPCAVFADSAFLPLKTAIFIMAVVLFVVSAAVYMNCDMGISPYDAIPVIISCHLPRLPFPFVRILYDITMVTIGVLFCAKKNPYLLHSLPGALAMSFLLGPAITLVGKCMKRKTAPKT